MRKIVFIFFLLGFCKSIKLDGQIIFQKKYSYPSTLLYDLIPNYSLEDSSLNKWIVGGYNPNFSAAPTAFGILSAAYIRGQSTYSTATTPDYTWYNDLTTGIFHLYPHAIGITNNGVESMRISAAGEVGIGIAPQSGYKLVVNGKVGAQEVNVKSSSPWPDFVFSDSYKLPSLVELKTYIQKEKHLPGFLSAKEIEKQNSIDVGATQLQQQKTIEEAYLYIFQLKDENQELRTELNEIKKQLNRRSK